ncbi:MAG: conserved membrane protein of unknown function [Candidatus Thorarchaeota archaeon]|nr:MAG: conserved membrane protein of unknown function [Candidatus Thorarchaeota archaeon]
MEPWQIIVALIQGLVEWLPISSEGQAVLYVYNFATIPMESMLTLVVWLHLGTTLAVIVRYPRTILNIISIQDRKLVRSLLIATCGTAMTAIPLYIFLKETLTIFHGEIINIFVGGLLFVTALFLYLPTRHSEEEVIDQVEEPEDRQSLLAGLAQGFAVLPGLSRSGITISALLMQKIEKEEAMTFSFLMSVPAVLGIFVLDVIIGEAPLPVPIGDLVVIEIIVFVVGLASMEVLLRLAKKVSFWKLCIVLGTVAIIFGIPALI